MSSIHAPRASALLSIASKHQVSSMALLRTKGSRRYLRETRNQHRQSFIDFHSRCCVRLHHCFPLLLVAYHVEYPRWRQDRCPRQHSVSDAGNGQHLGLFQLRIWLSIEVVFRNQEVANRITFHSRTDINKVGKTEEEVNDFCIQAYENMVWSYLTICQQYQPNTL